jgi:hypothetical protein
MAAPNGISVAWAVRRDDVAITVVDVSGAQNR